MSSDRWFAAYERAEAEAWDRTGVDPHLTPESREALSEAASEALREQQADLADRLHDESKHG